MLQNLSLQASLVCGYEALTGYGTGAGYGIFINQGLVEIIKIKVILKISIQCPVPKNLSGFTKI